MRRIAAFVNGGNDRAIAGLNEAIRAKVLLEFDERLRQATFWQRVRLRCEIREEVRRRLAIRAAEKAPPDALY